MSLLKRLLFGDDSNDTQSPEDKLRELFAERENDLQLTAVFAKPQPDMQDKPTVVFPFDLIDGDGELYGGNDREFFIPDDGFNEDSALARFVSDVTGVDEPTTEDMFAVEGKQARAEIDTFGETALYLDGGDDE